MRGGRGSRPWGSCPPRCTIRVLVGLQVCGMGKIDTPYASIECTYSITPVFVIEVKPGGRPTT